MFAKMLVLGKTRFTDDTKAAFQQCAAHVEYDEAVPVGQEALARRIGDADALLVALEVEISGAVIRALPALRYIGMCCSLYDPASANVDILAARERGVMVTGIRDYGDEGVTEYVVSELTSLLHGFHGVRWRDEPTELTGVRCGILGMGTVGGRVAAALQFFGASVCYYSRTRKQDAETRGAAYLPLAELLAHSDILVCCLNKNAIVLHREQFAALGNGKIIVNIAIGPCSEAQALAEWLQNPGNYFLCDTPAPLGDQRLLALPNVLCPKQCAGASVQSTGRYNEKILANVRSFLRSQEALGAGEA